MSVLAEDSSVACLDAALLCGGWRGGGGAASCPRCERGERRLAGQEGGPGVAAQPAPDGECWTSPSGASLQVRQVLAVASATGLPLEGGEISAEALQRGQREAQAGLADRGTPCAATVGGMRGMCHVGWVTRSQRQGRE